MRIKERFYSLWLPVQVKAHGHGRAINKGHHYFELAYCLSSLMHWEIGHLVTNGGLAVIVLLALIAHEE